MGVFALAISAKAQTYLFETFDSQGAGWTNVDQDADGYKWSFIDYASGDNQGMVARSDSWSSTDGPLTPNNFLTSPAITLGSTNLTLNFKVKGQDPSYSQEHYAVYVTASNTVSAITASTPVLEETLPANTVNYSTKTVDLSAFSGQTVYVTFRHFNISDMFAINIDDVIVGVPPADEVAMASVTLPSGSLPGNVSVKGTVKNYGTNAITSLDVSYDAGAGAVNATIPSLNIAPGATYTFTHPTPLAVSLGNTYTVNVCATITNDAIASNNCGTGTIDFIVSSVIDKYVVVEEKTGTWCGWCPRGTVALDNLHANEPKAFEIAIHNADPMTVSSYDSGSANFPDMSGYPYTAVDRVEGTDPGDVVPAVNNRKLAPAPASISFDAATISGNTITVTPKVTMVATMTGDYRLAVVLIEDGVKGTGSTWLQHNYYSSTDQNIDLIDGNGTNWKNLPGTVDQSATLGGFNHVARALANNAINGSAGSLPGTLTNAQSYTHTYTFTKDASWDVSKMHAVAMFVKNSTGEVLNSGQTAITGTAGLTENTATQFGVEAYPNPSNGAANVKVALENESTVSISVYNMIGEIVYQVPATTLAAGTHVYPVNLMNAQSGVYFAHVSVNGTNQVVKINVVK